jgi:hypothetical protein
MRFFRWALILCVLLAGPATADESRLSAFGREVGLADIGGFVETIESLDRTGRLPPRYVAKKEAEGLGWKPGGDLCRVAPGRSIGGDRFGNREKRLPETKGRRWYEADLDSSCGRRGAKRLVYSSDGLRFVTIDHYESFREVPR